MKTGRAAMWANWRTLAVTLMALGVTAGCGKTNTTESGETHFVSCNSDADCSGVTDAHTCDGGLCRGPANDGSTPSSKPPACDGGCGDSECATPGTCTLAAACKVVDCGTAVFDDNACVRPGCENDDGCPDDERCAAVWWSKHYQCEQKGANCECQAGLGLFPLNICSPIALAGARGEWQKLVVTDEVNGDSTVRTFMPDGSVTIEQHSPGTGATVPSTAQLSAEDLDALTRQINGPVLRLKLAEPEACPTNINPCPSPGCRDYVVDLYLGDTKGSGGTTATPTLSKNVTGCLNPPAEVVEFGDLIDLVGRY
jgi:hypothetical protein